MAQALGQSSKSSGYKGLRPMPLPELPMNTGWPSANGQQRMGHPLSPKIFGGHNPMSPLLVPLPSTDSSPTGLGNQGSTLSPVLIPTNQGDDGLMLVVRHTFIDAQAPKPTLRYSRSDSDLSCASNPASPVFPPHDWWGTSGQDVQQEPPPEYTAVPSAMQQGAPSVAETVSQISQAVGVQAQGLPHNVDDDQDPDAPSPSVGSVGHFEGTCHPCCFFRRSRCTLGQDCLHCHYRHETKNHPGKKTRDRARAKAKREQIRDGPAGLMS